MDGHRSNLYDNAVVQKYIDVLKSALRINVRSLARLFFKTRVNLYIKSVVPALTLTTAFGANPLSISLSIVTRAPLFPSFVSLRSAASAGRRLPALVVV